MEGLGAAASVIAVVQLSSKVASLCTEYFKAVKNARSDIKRLQKELAGLNVVLRSAEGLVQGSDGNKLQTTGQLKPALDEASSQLRQLINDLKDKQGKPRKATRRDLRALKWPFKRPEVDNIIQNLERIRDNILMALDIDNTALHIETHSTVQEISTNVQHISRTLDISKIPVAKGAAFDSHTNEHDPKCLPNTRVELRQNITTWAEDPDSDTIFWLNGMAGTGKSTISRSIAHSFAMKKILGASFFFKRGERDRGNASRLFTTIAAQLIIRLPEIGPLAIKAVEDDPDLPNKFIQEQFEKLILGPLHELDNNISNSRVLVLVVDALDECDRLEDVKRIINVLTSLRSLTSIKLKAFVTSRPELPIRLGFDSIKGKYRDLVLHEMPKPVIEHDISEFLRHQLEQARLEYNCQSDPKDQLGPDWPGTQATNALIQMAIPLFIFAATMCRFIQDPLYDPVIQLEKVLMYKSSGQDSEMEKLDATYRPTLDQLLVDRTGRSKARVLKIFRDVVGTIVLLEEPLSISTLSCLVDIPERVISGILRPLHSVLSVPISPQEPVRMLHLSFHDFLVDKELHKTNPFWVDEPETHDRIATKCLDLLRSGKHLKQDICDLGWPGARRKDLEQGDIDLKLPDQVRYACLYWAHHLEQSGFQITDSHSAFSFLKEYFLFWLEALALLGEAHNCGSMIASIQSLVDPKHGAGLSAFLRDAARFVTRVDYVVDKYPLQIYASGLVFAPSESIVRTAFRKCIPEWITQLPQVSQSWDASLRVIETSLGYRNAICFLPDSRSLQAVSEDGLVQVWDTMTGKQLDSIKTDGGYQMIFSSDGKCSLSTIKDQTILFWVTPTRTFKHRFEESIQCLALSSDGKMAACALKDGMMFVLDYLGGTMRQRSYGEKGEIGPIALSPDGELFAIIRSHGLQLWGVNTGRNTKELPGFAIKTPCFSPDSRLIALVDWNDVVVVYDVRMGKVFRQIQGHTGIVSAIAFAPDGQHVASASDDKTARLWHLATGKEVHRFEHDCNSIDNLVFSPDGCLLAASSLDDSTILIWDLKSTAKNDENDTKGPIYYLALSRDGKHVASGSENGSVGIWDLDTAYQIHVIDEMNICDGEIFWLSFSQVQENLIWLDLYPGSVQWYDILTGETDELCDDSAGGDMTFLALSPDGGTILVAVQGFEGVQIWDLMTKKMQHSLKTKKMQHLLKAERYNFDLAAFSSDSKMLAFQTTDHDVVIWELESGRGQKLSIGHHHQNSDFTTALSLHDSILATSSRSGRLAFWDAKTGAHLGSFQADGSFNRLKFDTDGSRLITDRGDINIPPMHDHSFDDSRPLRDLEGYGLTERGSWVSWKSKPFMWLPRSHRPGPLYNHTQKALILGSTAVFGSMSGRVSILKFVDTPPWASRGDLARRVLQGS